MAESPSKKGRTEANTTNTAFVFIKPHAVTDKTKALVKERFAKEGITVRSEGSISAEKIDKQMLIDTHYGAIANRAMRQKPADLAIQDAAKDAFQKAFGLTWADALEKGLVYNLEDGSSKLGCSKDDLGDKYDKLKKGVDMIKFGGGFYCGKVDDIYVINGFYARMRAAFVKPDTCIYYFDVSWDSSKLVWADFRGKVLGGTDPKTADAASLRHVIFQTWKDLGLASEPNTGDNGVHASASPFEALAERVNWLGANLETDAYGAAMVKAGISVDTLKAWSEDPAVPFDGKKQSLFDLLEDLDSVPCIEKAVAVNAVN